MKFSLEKTCKPILRPVSWPVFLIAVSLMYALTINLLEFTDITENHIKGFGMIFAQWAIVSLTSMGVIGLISANKYVFAPLFPLICILSTVEVFYRLTLGAGITGTTIEIAMENNLVMWTSVIEFKLILWLLLSLAISIFIVVYRWKYVKFKGKASYVFLFISIVLTFCPFFISRIYGAVSNRMPLAVYNGIREYYRNMDAVKEERTTYDNVKVDSDSNAPDVILVVGESLRGDHLPMNGYERQTMPLISALDNIVAFRNMRSTGSHTCASLPYLFTEADSLNAEKGYDHQSFITLFNKAGYKTAWLANQDISNSYSYFAHEPDTLFHINSQRSLYTLSPWLDMEVIKPFMEWNEKPGPKLTVIHAIGSHWWYKSHYAEEDAVFKPEIDSKELSVLSAEQLINSYDNTIIATDRFLKNLIETQKDRNSVIIFISDHGESLGEEGRWLHATDAPELHNVACIVWYSTKYAELFPEKIEALKVNSKKTNTSDELFHSILDAASLRTSVLDKSKSWFHHE